jgi:nucleotide-binding universal stress UspA family protein
MMKSILVPTDGSPLSERALPLALELAEAQQAELHLVQGVEYLPWLDVGPDGFVDAAVYQQVMDALDAQAQQNLQALAEHAASRGVPVMTAIFHGSPGAGLLDYEAQTHPELVVMATHGRTGLARFARGSVADMVVREGIAPVLLVRPFGPQPTTTQRAVVPLDGSALAERALPIVASLAGRPLQSVVLVRAVQDSDERLVEATCLSVIANRIHAMGLAVELDLPLRPPGEAIVRAAAEADLVIMATHGRGGLDRLRHGSVAEQVLREGSTPVLLVRAAVPSLVEVPAVKSIAQVAMI